ncbi:MAG: DNA ligase-associated DEXH box helicase [Erythrobacter sp.]|nr:DNA ligase-associated DEXH box helicase [Erythrobacter sp.]
MAAPFSWIKPEPHGIYVEPADCWVDPSRAVGQALVTHGHADHARGGHGQTVATPETLAIMDLRYNTRAGATPVEYGETIRLKGGVDATYIPAGHVLGSAQILLEHAGERVIVTGDYKRRADPTCPPFEVTACDIFITEATFGLPVFCHPPIKEEMTKLLDRLAAHIRGHIVICPPSALNDRWSRRLPDPVTAMASGWMRVRQRARQRNVELPLVISDHADWGELTRTIEEVDAQENWITHGREDALLRWCQLHQRRARALALVGYEDEDD